MAINEITDAEIRKYILGSVPAELSDRLDELSFVDEYSERIGAVERELVDDYVNGKLGPAEKPAFESHYLVSPIRRERVTFAGAFANYAEKPHLAGAEGPAKTSIFDLFRQRFFVLQLGAAALLVMFAVAWLILRERSFEVAQNVPANFAPEVPLNDTNSELTALKPASQTPSIEEPPPAKPRVSPSLPIVSPTPRPPKPKDSPANLAVFLLSPALRGSSFETIRVPADARSADFLLRLETEDLGPFTAEIVDLRTQARIWSTQKASARKGRSGITARIRVPTRALKAGEYKITLSRSKKESDTEKVGDYYLRVAQ